jgi:signal transduction histidine kinase
VHGRSEARGRLAEQELVSATERARRATLEERTRIARELHDVVAHHMSVIAIQAQAALYRVPDLPAELATSFTTIRTNALQALTELRRVLGVLRADDSGDTRPQPTLANINDLVGNVRATGATVASAVRGSPRQLPPGVELSAYRIVQEALSNAIRHAPGAEIRVEIAYRPTDLMIRVVNGAPHGKPSGSTGPGHGVPGMRERAAMLGGELSAGLQPCGGYELTAVLPIAEGEDA